MYYIVEFTKDKIGYDMWEIKVLVPNFNLYFYWIMVCKQPWEWV